MKKLTALFLSLACIFGLTLSVGAASCSHSYTQHHLPADCLFPERTVFTCTLCGDSYTQYAYEYNDTGDFSFVFETERDDENKILTLSANLYNNPGLSIAIMQVGYNTSALTPLEYINGTVWEKGEINLGRDIDLNRKPLKVYAERTTDDINYENGLYFKIVFRIDDVNGDYGFQYTLRRLDFVNAVTGEAFAPKAHDLTGKREKGKHSMTERTVLPTCTENGYTESVCTLCGHSEKTEITSPSGHTWGNVQVVTPPTSHETGEGVKKCDICGTEENVTLPVIEAERAKGDINNDGKVNATDVMISAMFVSGDTSDFTEDDMLAADMNGDGKVNSVDSNLICAKVING